MSVAIKMTGDERDLVKAQERVEKGAAGITAEYKKLAKESLETQRYAKKAWEESLSPLERYHAGMEKLNRTYQGTARESAEYKAAVAKLEQQHLTLNKAGVGGLQSIGKEMAGLIGPFATIGGSIQTIVAGINTWVQNTRDIAKTTNDAMKEVVAFAAMQEPGVAKARAMEILSLTAGVMKRGEAWDVAQAMQSAATGTESERFAKAKVGVSQIADAIRMGMPEPEALEVARQAIAQGQDLGGYLRGVFTAGEAGIRDVPTMAKGAPGLLSWSDKTLGMAALAQIGGLKGAEPEPFLRAAGEALSGVSPARAWFEAQGLGPEATQQQRLQKLVEAGINTAEKLQMIGITEERARPAVQTLVDKYRTVLQYRELIGAGMAEQNLLRRRRAEVESGIPELAYAEQIAAQQSEFEASRSFNLNAQRQVLYEKKLAAELAKRGIQQGLFGQNLYDAEGNLSPFWFSATRTAEFLGMGAGVRGATGGGRPMADATEAANRHLESIDRNTSRPARPVVPTPEQ